MFIEQLETIKNTITKKKESVLSKIGISLFSNNFVYCNLFLVFFFKFFL